MKSASMSGGMVRSLKQALHVTFVHGPLMGIDSPQLLQVVLISKQTCLGMDSSFRHPCHEGAVYLITTSFSEAVPPVSDIHTI